MQQLWNSCVPCGGSACCDVPAVETLAIERFSLSLPGKVRQQCMTMSEACHKRHAERDCRTRQTQRRLAGGDQGLPPLLWPSPPLHPHREGCLPCLLAAWSSLPAVRSACHARNNMHSRHTKTRRGHADAATQCKCNARRCRLVGLRLVLLATERPQPH